MNARYFSVNGVCLILASAINTEPYERALLQCQWRMLDPSATNTGPYERALLQCQWRMLDPSERD